MGVFNNKKSLWNKKRNTFEFYLTGSGALNEVLDEGKDIYLKEVRLHLSAGATQEDFTVSIDSGKGPEFDIKLFAYDMSEDLEGTPGVVTDLVWRPSSLLSVDGEDTVVFTWDNTDALTWGLTVIAEG